MRERERERERGSWNRFCDLQCIDITSEDNVFMIMTLTQIDPKAIKTMTNYDQSSATYIFKFFSYSCQKLKFMRKRERERDTDKFLCHVFIYSDQ